MLAPVGVRRQSTLCALHRTAAAPYSEDIRQPLRAAGMSSLFIARIHRPWASRLVDGIACPSLCLFDGLSIVSRETMPWDHLVSVVRHFTAPMVTRADYYVPICGYMRKTPYVSRETTTIQLRKDADTAQARPCDTRSRQHCADRT